MKTKIKRIVLTLFILFINSTYSQIIMDRNLLAQVNQSVISRYGQSVKVQFIYHVDSSHINQVGYPTPYETMDNYGTLINSTIFTGYKYNNGRLSKGIVGVYKDGNIIWDSDTTINLEEMNALTLFSTADLNKGGKIDLIFAADYFTASGNGVERLYIYSWDGNNGQLITELDSTGVSTIVSLTGVGEFDFVDVNGDGIYEITGDWVLPPDDQKQKQVTYYWNGINYCFNTSLPQPKESDFLVQNNIDVTLKARISKSDSGYVYNYLIHNLPTSKQVIDLILFRLKIDSLNEPLPPYGWTYIEYGDLLGFEDLEFPEFNGLCHFLKVDSSKTFGFNSKCLPGIVNVYVQAYNSQPPIDDSISTVQDDYNNILTNSNKSLTIGPSNISDTTSLQGILDTLINHCNQSISLNWIMNQSTVDKYNNLFTSAKTQLQQNNNNEAKTTLQAILQQVDIDSTSNLTSEAYALIKYNTEYLLDHLPSSNPVSLAVNLENSSNSLLTGGTLQYYDGAWKDAVNNEDGTFGINTDKPALSLRMFYAYGSQTVSNIPAQNNTYTFRTVNVSAQLKDSQGNPLDTGTVQYYAGAWRDFGTTTNGVAAKELLPNNYSFRMTYAYASKDKQQNIGTDPNVIFQTVNANVELKNSLGNLIDQGTVQYYAGAWRDFGTTTNGVAAKELLPNNYSFRMTHEYISKDIAQNIGANNVVPFSTVLCTVRVKNSQGQPLNNADAKYYSGAWREIGLTSANGEATKELLPANLSFRVNYGNVQQDKKQDISLNNIVDFTLNTGQ